MVAVPANEAQGVLVFNADITEVDQPSCRQIVSDQNLAHKDGTLPIDGSCNQNGRIWESRTFRLNIRVSI